jgi:hypothetical protein
MRSPEAPPLRTLIIAGAIAGAALAGGWWQWLDYQSRLEDLREERVRLRLERVARAEPGTFRMVGVGTSLLQCATLRDEGLEALASELGLPLVYVDTSLPAGGMLDWRGMLEEILETRPDVILLEDSHLFYRMRVRQRLWSRYLGLCRRMVRQAVTQPADIELPPAPAVAVEREERVDLVAVPRTVEEGELRLRRRFYNDSLIFGLRPGSREILRRAAAQGTRALVFEVPVHERAMATVPWDHGPRIREELRRLEAEGLLAEGLRCPLTFEEEDFVDLYHLGPGGRERVSRWLLAELAARFPEFREDEVEP